MIKKHPRVIQNTIFGVIVGIILAIATSVYATSLGTNLSVTGNLVVSSTSATSTFAAPIAASSGNQIISSAGTTNNLLLNPYGGNVGIGSSTPQEKLSVQGGSIFQAPGNPVVVGGVDYPVGNATYGVTGVGRYLYVVGGTCCGGGMAGTEFSIYDVTVPSAPVFIGGVETNVEIRDVAVAGKYAYTLGYGLPTNSFNVIDISNPSAPKIVGGLNLVTQLGERVRVFGNYAYVITGNNSGSSCPSQCEFKIIDISNPYAPRIVGTADIPSTGPWPNVLFVSGRYAYVGTEANASGSDFYILDISNPAVPVIQTALNIGASIQVEAIYVSGRYAYLGLSDNTMRIYDISNAASPTLISTLFGTGGGSLANDGSDMWVSGRYAYTMGGNGNQILSVVDVGNPSNPQILGSVDISRNVRAMFVSGRYAYTVSRDNPSLAPNRKLTVIDLSGTESASVTAHSLEAGNLQVRDDGTIGGRLTVSGGAVIGGNLKTDGSLVASATTTPNIMLGLLGLATTSPYAQLSVTSRAIATTTLALRPIASQTANIIDIYNTSGTLTSVINSSGNLGIGTTSPWRTFSTVGTVGLSSSLTSATTGNYLCINTSNYEITKLDCFVKTIKIGFSDGKMWG